jgi:hypothetical protein
LFIIPGVDDETGIIDSKGCVEYSRGDTLDVISAIWAHPDTLEICRVVYRNGKEMILTNYQLFGENKPSSLTDYTKWNCPSPICLRKMDVALILDESGSLDAQLWAKEIDFATKLVDSYAVGPDAANFAVIYFASTARVLLPLTADAGSVKNVLTSTARRGGTTRQATGINAAVSTLASPLPGRTGVSKVIIFIGDGRETWNQLAAIDLAVANIPAGTTRIAISPSNTTNTFDINVLRKIAGDPNNVILATYDTLPQRLNQVVSQTCTELPVQPCGSTCYGLCSCDRVCLCPRCTNTTICSSTSCVPGQDFNGCKSRPITCPDDYNACTYSQCTEEKGCENLPVTCFDGSMCTEDKCDSLSGCLHPSINCDDKDACTEDNCDYLTGCVHTNLTCDDGNACTEDSCSSTHGCVHKTVVCNDGLVCTNDRCDTIIGCVTTPVICNATNQCFDSTCYENLGGCIARNCDDKDDCTKDSCIPATGCKYEDVDCSACRLTPLNCSTPEHKKVCFNAACGDDGEGNATCLYTSWNGTVCNTFDKCNIDYCDPATETCKIIRKVCPHIACKKERCDAFSGECVYEDLQCVTKDPCKLANCSAELDSCVVRDNPTICPAKPCQSVVCIDQGASLHYCEYTDNTCDFGSMCVTGKCNPADEKCEATPVNCEDGLFCTVDSCNITTGCVHSETRCDDQNLCTIDICNEANQTCGHKFACDDGMFCTIDSCLPDGSCLHSSRACNLEIDIGGSSCFIVACNEKRARCEKRIAPTAEIDVCGDCIELFSTNLSTLVGTSSATINKNQLACLSSWVMPTVIAASITTAAIAGIVIAAVIGVIIVLIAGSLGTYELVRRAGVARSKSAVENPLYQSKQNEGSNPVFEGRS